MGERGALSPGGPAALGAQPDGVMDGGEHQGGAEECGDLCFFRFSLYASLRHAIMSSLWPLLQADQIGK